MAKVAAAPRRHDELTRLSFSPSSPRQNAQFPGRHADKNWLISSPRVTYKATKTGFNVAINVLTPRLFVCLSVCLCICRYIYRRFCLLHAMRCSPRSCSFHFSVHQKIYLKVHDIQGGILLFVPLNFIKYQPIFSARCNIYISRLCYDVSVRLSVRLSVCL